MMLTFHTNKIKRKGRKVPSILERTISSSKISKGQFLSDCFKNTVEKEVTLDEDQLKQ